MPELSSPQDRERVLREARVIAVLGAHHKPGRAATYVPEFLHGEGYRILPVNSQLVGRTLWGQPVRGTLAELGEPVDVVVVFRRSDAVPEHVDDILAMKPLPGVVWLQQGIRNEAAAARLIAAGIDVVQDHCALADHRTFRISRIA